MNIECPDCGVPLPQGRIESVCPACFFAAAQGPVVGKSAQWKIPDLIIGSEISRGGMGIVYAAEQVEPKRAVALKILLPQWIENAPVVERFRREARAMAQLEHVAILPVYQVGETDGLPWFTMKLAAKGSLAEHLASFTGHWQQSAALVARLAEALAHAHERGVLHRDIKPGNILFDAEGSGYLADFGLAKNQTADSESLTLHADVLGTPNYLAPEIASGKTRAATTSSDIYSLGAVLYELLSGRPPHRDDHLPALLRQVADEEPMPLDHFRPTPPRDLCAICEKAIHREAALRYPTSRIFAEDLNRYLRGELIQARNAGMWEMLLRACHRHPAIASLLGLVVVLFGVMTIGATLGVVRIQRAEQAAIAERIRAEASLRTSQLSEAEGLRRARQPRFRQMALEKVLAAGTPEESIEMRVDRRSEAIASLAMPSLHHAALPPGPKGWRMVALAPGHGFTAWQDPGDAGWLVARASDGVVVSSNRLGALPTRLSRDGRWLVAQVPDRDSWQLWDISSSEAVLKREGTGTVEDLSDDGHLIAARWTGSDNSENAEVLEVPELRARFRLRFPRVTVKMRFNGDGSLCAVAPSSYLNDSSFPYSVRVHRCDDGSVHRELSSGLANCIWAMEFSRDGEWLAAGERGGATYVWGVRTGNARHVFHGTGADVWQLAFSEDSRLLAMISEGRLLTLYDTVGGQPVARAGEVWQSAQVPLLSWSAQDPRTFGPISQDGRETCLTLKPGAYASFVAPDSHGSALGIDLAPGGRWLAVGDSRHARVWDLRRTGWHDTFAQGLWNSFAFSPDGMWLFGAGEPGVFRWEVTEHGVQRSSRTQLMPAGWHNAVTLDSTGSRLAAESGDTGKIGLFSRRDRDWVASTEFESGAASWISLSPDGARLAVAGWDGLDVWNTTNRAKVLAQKPAAHWVDFSPDGRWLVVGRDRYEILSTSDWSKITSLDSRAVGPHQSRAAFTPDGRWLATGHPFGKIALWRTASWDRVGVLESPSGNPVGRFTFDTAGDHLFNATTGGVIESWDLKLLATELQRLGLGW